MDFKALNVFAKQRTDMAAQLRDAEAELEKKKRERDQLIESRPPNDDLFQLYCSYVDKRAEAHIERVLEFDMNETHWISWARDGDVYPLLESNGGHYESNRVHADAMYAVLAPMAKEYAKKLIDRKKWPGKPGPALADRPALIKKLDAEITQLESQINNARDIIN